MFKTIISVFIVKYPTDMTNTVFYAQLLAIYHVKLGNCHKN